MDGYKSVTTDTAFYVAYAEIPFRDSIRVFEDANKCKYYYMMFCLSYTSLA